MKMFRKTLTFCKTSRKILDINVSAALMEGKSVVPMEITFMDNGGNIFILCEFTNYVNSHI